MDTDDLYVVNYLKARQSLLETQARLKKASTSLASSESEQAAALVAFLEMTEEIADLDAAHAAIKATYTPGVNPPAQALVDKSLQIATALGTVIAKARKAEAILDAVTQLVDAWKLLATGTAPAAAPAPAG